MDYKKIITSRRLRIRILYLLNFLPDRLMLKLQYRIKTGRSLNLKNPRRYTEKLQWYKAYYRDSLMAQCADKCEVRKYVEKCGLKNILNDSYGVFEKTEDIPFVELPSQYVLKDTLGGGNNSVIIVKNKEDINETDICRQMQTWLDEPYKKKNIGREWVYEGRKHRIIIEKYIESNPENGGLIDYKFLCFDGKIELVYVLADRIAGIGAGCGFYDTDFNKLPYSESDEPPLMREIIRPSNFDEMKKVAEVLAKPFPCARIDLYNEKDKIIFGEITFFDSSGYMVFSPDELDFRLGEKFVLRKKECRGTV